MDSSLSKKLEEERRQDEIKRQIILLQAKLKDPNASIEVSKHCSPKRKEPESKPLVPSTPSPKKRKLNHARVNENVSTSPIRGANRKSSRLGPHVQLSSPRSAKGVKAIIDNKSLESSIPPQSAPSHVLSKLSTLSNRHKGDDSHAETMIRSSAFSDTPAQNPSSKSHGSQAISCYRSADVVTTKDSYGQDEQWQDTAPKRDDRLALVEDLEVGSTDHKPPFDDPHFEKLEPNSGIRLSYRAISHDNFQEYLRARYYLSPSRLYSVIRLLPSKAGYEVPVIGDWVTIGVVAERGPVKFSRAPVGATREDDGLDGEEGVGSVNSKPGLSKQESTKNGKGGNHKNEKNKPSDKPSGKRYVNLKLIDFGARSRGSSSATGGKAVIRGDAFLTLLLFESDGFELVERGEGEKPEKVYKGGSKGAFESMAKLKEGAVVALLNPKILKPFQRSNDTPHPVNNILALTPESASSIAVVGQAKDLGMCTVVKRDGKVCGGWCDKRVSEVCEYHVQHAVERRRAGRSEFSIGTTGMSTTSAPKRKPHEYDPARQWGLKPEASMGTGSVYVVSGHVVSGGKDLYVGENLGREGQAKAARKVKEKDEEKALKMLLGRDREGMRALMRAREVGLAEREGMDGGGDKKKGGTEKRKVKGPGKNGLRDVKGKRKDKTKLGVGDDLDLDESEGEDLDSASGKKNAFSAKVIKHLGFDPTAMTKIGQGQRRMEDDGGRKKLDALASFQSTRLKEVNFDSELAPRPGRHKSGVFAPTRTQSRPQSLSPGCPKVNVKAKTKSGSDFEGIRLADDELEAEELLVFGKAVGLGETRDGNVDEKMVDLESDDSD